jgi:hypothetical protein
MHMCDAGRAVLVTRAMSSCAQNDPSVPDGAGPELTPEKAQELQQDESAGASGGAGV